MKQSIGRAVLPIVLALAATGCSASSGRDLISAPGAELVLLPGSS
jgi:hypothetical protein